MNTRRLIPLIFLSASLCACQQQSSLYPDIADTSRNELQISSNDTALVSVFHWASERSESYVGEDTDPVGPWYEAALPEREAFCMRDISHQCIGEEINGHGRQNLNMFTRFVENISEAKDYCTYWEINKDNLPAPVDYENDQDFWYNLNANFDLMDACYRLYLWTGERRYISDPRFLNFFRLTSREYIERWQLEPDRIMQRRAVMNVRGDVSQKRFKRVRGLPSYEESVPHLKVTGDLLATMFRGLHSYASILELNDEKAEAEAVRRQAEAYAQLYDSLWWNPASGNYYSYCLDDDTFSEGGTNMFPLRFGIARQPERIQSILHLMETVETNVETMSYYPLLFCQYGKPEVARRFIDELYQNERRDYPEVSSGLLEGIVCGIAGVQAHAAEQTLSTCPQLPAPTEWLALENIPVFSGSISLIHYNNRKTALVNKTGETFVWRACFPGEWEQILLDGEPLAVRQGSDALGNRYSYAEVECPKGVTLTLEAIN